MRSVLASSMHRRCGIIQFATDLICHNNIDKNMHKLNFFILKVIFQKLNSVRNNFEENNGLQAMVKKLKCFN
jgi:hypothetical protein